MPYSIENIRDVLSRHQNTTFSELTPEIIRAAVLIPLVPIGEELHVLLTVRTEEVETHKGQISFPGGVYDVTDTSLIATALRETHEEVGIPPSSIEVLGGLDDLITPFQFCITPVVGYISELPILHPNPSEVAKVFYVPLSFLAEPANRWKEERTSNGRSYPVWFYQYQRYCIWGATAGLLKKFIDVISTEKEAT